jgi:hypothetical protein
VISEQVGDFLPSVRVEVLEDFADGYVKGLTVAACEGTVGRFLNQRVAKEVGQVRLLLQQSDQAERLERLKLGL